MTFFSYAQNYEDVLLWRALQHVDAGFYLDVGAMDPDTHSVTRAFYDRGWRGVNVEPSPSHAARVGAARPRDVTLQCAAGAVIGQTELLTVPGTGLSSLMPEARAVIERAGFAGHLVHVQMRTLDDICREHAPAVIHFLKIDVEGAEHDVLRGANFQSFRPWIVLVEATAPMSNVETYRDWEPLLLEARYQFVWFDGLNRFYVADEQHAALAGHFKVPPNVFDNFVQVLGSDAAQRITELTAELAAVSAEARLAEARSHGSMRRLLDTSRIAAAARDRITALIEEATWHRNEVAAAQALVGRLRAEIGWYREQLEQAKIESGNRLLQLNHLIATIASIRVSLSWRLMAPIRRIGRMFVRPLNPPLAAEPSPGLVAQPFFEADLT